MYKTLCGLLFITNLAIAQAPDISYSTPNVFDTGVPISPLTPSNVGGAVISGRIVSTFAGSGSIGAADGNGTAASFNLPTVVTLDSYQNIFVVDRSNNKIRKITPSGDVTTFAGSGAFGSTDGNALNATFNYPDGAVFDSHNNLFVSDQSNHKIRKITPDGTVSTFAGTGLFGDVDGNGSVAQFYYPAGMAVDTNDNVYVADYGNNKIRLITPEGVVSTFAGSGVAGAADGTALAAQFNGCTGVGIDSFGNVLVADYYNNKIRKIDTLGNVTTLAGNGSIGSSDGLGSNARFYYPAIVAVDSDNNVFITDEENHKIRKIDTAAEVTTYAGTGTMGDVDGLANTAQFNSATGVTVDTNHNVYVCDYGNHKIRKINNYGYSITPDLPDGLHFDTTTGIISGTPINSQSPTDYIIKASNPDGNSTFVITITINQLDIHSFTTSTVELYPNPVNNVLNIKAQKPIASVHISNLLGEEIITKTNLDNKENINMTNLANGMYMVKVTMDNTEKTFKIWKQ